MEKYITYAWLLIFTYFCMLLLDIIGITSNDKWRVKKKRGLYIIQTRWKFSPIWHNFGMGDVCGWEFSPFVYQNKDKAIEKMKQCKAEEERINELTKL